MRFVLSFLLLSISGCTLAENKGIEEAKDYIGQVHEVGLADYEFEGRLESFYESEPIGNEDLIKLYNGEFPEGEMNPGKLRIHWKAARELALAELELQRLFQKNWNDAGVSERPILILDRDGGDFYRYYEYRIVKDNKFLGAIRIPAYRRTENFATAEVHFYSEDEKTYTVRPTGWGRYMAENNSCISKSSIFFIELENLIALYLADNVIYNWMYRIYDQLEVRNENLINPEQNYNILKDFYSKKKNSIPNLKKSLSMEQQNVIIENMTRSKFTEVNNNIQTLGNILIKLETIASEIDKFRIVLKETTLMSYSNFYMEANEYILSNMVHNPTRKSQLQSILKDIIWDIIEQNKNSHQQLINYDWEFGSLFSQKGVSPVIQYNNFHKYPKRDHNNNKFDLLSSQYKLLTIEEHEHAMLLSAGLLTDRAGIELYNSIQSHKIFVNEKIPKNILDNALVLNDNTNSKFIISAVNIILMPIKTVLLEFVNLIIAGIIDKVTDIINLPLEKLYDILEYSVNKLPNDTPQLEKYKNLVSMLDIVINSSGNVATDVVSRMFGSWSVWVIPIFPFPTWVHYTDKWGPVPTWQMYMGWPNFWTLKEFPLPEFDWLKPIPKPPVESVDVPSGLEDYQEEWLQIQYWLQENQVLTVNEDGSFKYGTVSQVEQVINRIIILIKKIYIHKIVVDYKTGEPIVAPTREQMNDGMVDLLNNDGREFIGQVMPKLPSMTQFFYIK